MTFVPQGYVVPCKRPHTGVGVGIINSDNKVLFQKRLKAPGAGKWSFPGGKIEDGESVIDCARREVLEETGLVLGEVIETMYTNDIDEEGHHITLYAISEYNDSALPVNKEPEKCGGLQWLDPDELPEDIEVWQPVVNFLAKMKKVCNNILMH